MPPLHLSTILAHSPSTLLTHITRLSSKYGGKGHTVLFALSSNFPQADDLQAVVNGLNAFNDNVREHTVSPTSENKNYDAKGRTIGCLVDHFSSTTLSGSQGDSVTSTNVSRKMEDALSCSIGIFDSSLCIPFRSELLGRTQPQVGRWHAFRKKGDLSTGGPGTQDTSGLGQADWEPDWGRMDHTDSASSSGAAANNGVDWEQIWNRSSSSASSTSSNLDLLPETLRSIDPEQVQALVTLSSPRPDTLTDVLSKALPKIPSLTLIASPTHFITGRPVTLFLDGQIHGEGAIGLAILRSRKENEIPESVNVNDTSKEAFSYRTEFLGVKRISSPMTITAREGNMINELDSYNPTKLLIKSIDLAGLSPSSSKISDSSTGSALAPASATPTHYFKDEEQFALGVLTPDGETARTYKITAGDPSSRGGSLSLDAAVAPEVGSVVQFLHFPSSSPIEIPPSLTGTGADASPHKEKQKQIVFLTVPEPSSSPFTSSGADESSASEMRVMNDTFLVPSTQGFVFSPGSSSTSSLALTLTRRQDVTWMCSLPGGSVVFEWNSKE